MIFTHVGTIIVSPESIGSYIVSYLMKLTQHHLGYDNVKSAIIAVPAKFDMIQRQATAQAFKLAGIKVILQVNVFRCTPV